MDDNEGLLDPKTNADTSLKVEMSIVSPYPLAIASLTLVADIVLAIAWYPIHSLEPLSGVNVVISPIEIDEIIGHAIMNGVSAAR